MYDEMRSGAWSPGEFPIMEEILHRPVEGKVVYPIIYKVLHIPGGSFPDVWTVNSGDIENNQF